MPRLALFYRKVGLSCQGRNVLELLHIPLASVGCDFDVTHSAWERLGQIGIIVDVMFSLVDGNGAEDIRTMKILVVADVVQPQLYNCSVTDWLPKVDFIISCGDLAPFYLDFLMSTLSVPLLHVKGNHCYVPHDPITKRCGPDAYQGAYDLNGRVVEVGSLIIAGLEGSPFYNGGPHQYTEQQVFWTLGRLYPSLFKKKLRTGRYLDLMVTHTPPRGVQDLQDITHRGFESLLGFMERFKPSLLLHGHSHRYDPTMPTYTRYAETDVINVYGHTIIDMVYEGGQRGWHLSDTSRLEVSNG